MTNSPSSRDGFVKNRTLILEKAINGAVKKTEPPTSCYQSGRSLLVGVLTNPHSGGNKKGLVEIRNILAKWPDVIHREAFDPEGISSSLYDFSRNGVELIVINGGDGTVQAALTILGNDKVFKQPPLLSLLCAGTTSMLPRDVGVVGTPAVALQRILEWSKSTNKDLVTKSRNILRVQTDSEAFFGMFFGAGAICDGIRVFHAKDNPMGWRGQLMPALTMVRLLLAILFNRIPPFLNNTSINGCHAEERADLLVLISTLDRLFLGMQPYWGIEEGPLHYTAIGEKPKNLLRVLLSLFGSGKSRHATPGNGYFSHNVEKVQLHMKSSFTLDGELYDAGEGAVTVSSAGPTLFLCSC